MIAVVLYVEVEVADGNGEAVRALIGHNAKNARETEPGCLQFDILEDPANPAILRFYEVYRDEAAFEAHQQTAHFKAWMEKGVPLLKSRRRNVYRRISP